MKQALRLLTALLMLMLLTGAVSAEECVHEYVEVIEEPTCEASGMYYFLCIHCKDIRDAKSLPPLDHSFGEWYVVTEPTDTKEGLQARDCVRCAFRETAPIDHLGHNYTVEVVAPTCTARGYTSHYCDGCGDRFRSDYTPPLGHAYDEITLLKEPTDTAKGLVRFTCIRVFCRDTYQMYYEFRDLDPDSYCFSPVMWALNKGVTSGVDGTHFAPEQSCNRAQVVTFLWRAAGRPEPKSPHNPFVDVPAGSFYASAVLWAYENGITTGTDATHFSPEALCNRAQVVTFLHRWHGCPEPDPSTSFPDVSPGSFYHKAVLWAAQRDITRGMDGGRFCPNVTCTRAQIVTFLYRDAKNP